MFVVSSVGQVQFSGGMVEAMPSASPSPVQVWATRILTLGFFKKVPALQVAGMGAHILMLTGVMNVFLQELGAPKGFSTLKVAGNLALLVSKKAGIAGMLSPQQGLRNIEEALTRGFKALKLVPPAVEVQVLPEAGREEMLPEGMMWPGLEEKLEGMSLEELVEDPFVKRVTSHFAPPCFHCGDNATVTFIEGEAYCSPCIREGAAPDEFYGRDLHQVRGTNHSPWVW